MGSAKRARRRAGQLAGPKGGAGEELGENGGEAPPPPPRAAPAWLPAAVVAAAGLAMLVWTWRTWPDPIIDFGREVYVAWRLAEGDVLYRDVAYLNGPLGAYWNSLWFRLLGPGILHLVAVNVALLALLAALLHRLLCRVATPFAAAAGGVALMTLFAFSRLVRTGNFNFAAPYSHDLPHGVLLSVVGITCAAAFQRTGRARWVAAAGAAVGLLLLTKVETILAGGAATLLGCGLALAADGADRRRWLGAALSFVGAAVVPPLLASGLLSLAMEPGAAFHGAVGHWLAAGREGVADLLFYRRGSGLDAPAANLRAMLAAALRSIVVLAPAAALAFAVRKPLRHPRIVPCVVFLVTVGVFVGSWESRAWLDATRALPLWLALLLAANAVVAIRSLRAGRPDAVTNLRVTLLVFGLLLLAKMALNVRLEQYGFALAMPATLLVVVALLDWVPAAGARWGAQASLFRAGAAGALVVAAIAHVTLTHEQISRLDSHVGSGADSFRTDERGPRIDEALALVASRAAPGQTLAVLPEGVMLNYLARRRNPTPYTVYLPLELALYGEENIVAALRKAPPDHVLIVHRDTREYGVGFFGSDWGRGLSTWLDRAYRPVELVGALPFQDARFGIVLMERRSPAASAARP